MESYEKASDTELKIVQTEVKEEVISLSALKEALNDLTGKRLELTEKQLASQARAKAEADWFVSQFVCLDEQEAKINAKMVNRESKFVSCKTYILLC